MAALTDRAAVRVSLGPVATADLEPIVVTPPASGSGDPPGGDAAEAVGERSAGATLRRLDAERAVLHRPGLADERVLLLPPAVAPEAPGVLRQEIVVGGWRVEVELEQATRAILRDRATRGHEERTHSGPSEVRAIIPGVVVSVSVAAGDEVVAGQQLLAVEAMKMQNELRAPRDGVIERVAVGPGTTIEVGDLLLVIA